MTDVIPDWAVPARVKSVSTTRQNGHSEGCWKNLNLGQHVGDDPSSVARNRGLLSKRYSLPDEPVWLNQVHGNDVIKASRQGDRHPVADAVWTNQPGVVLSIMTADCLPVLFSTKSGEVIAAAHAGWRGLAAGILQKTVTALPASASDVVAWLGPAIGPSHFEVGSEVRASFVGVDSTFHSCFSPSGSSKRKYYADIFELARRSLQRVGVVEIFGGGVCTFSDRERFYSHRRDSGATGRMASLIWLDHEA